MKHSHVYYRHDRPYTCLSHLF